jgi:hypothetical protein
MITPTNDAGSMRDYVEGRMSDAEREAFERRLLTDVNLVRGLEDSLRLREGLEVLREQKVLEGLTFPRRRALHMSFAWVSAGAVAALLLSVAFYYAKHSPPIIGASVAALSAGLGPAPPVTERHAFAGMRAQALTPELALPPSGALELRALTPVTKAGERFRVTLDLTLGQKISRIGGEVHLVPDADGFVVIYANASRLQPGEYLLTIERDEPQGSASGERFGFRLVRTPGVPTQQRP